MANRAKINLPQKYPVATWLTLCELAKMKGKEVKDLTIGETSEFLWHSADELRPGDLNILKFK